MSKVLIQNLLREELERRSNKSDKLLESYFNGLINESELIKGLDKEFKSLNENIVKKAGDWIMNKLAYLYNMALKGGEKVLNAISSIFKVLGKFRNKYPRIYKMFIILIITLILIIATASTAQAGEGGGQYTEQFLNASIGVLEELRGTYPEGGMESLNAFEDIAQAEHYLLNLKKGVDDTSDLSKEAIRMEKWAMDKINELVESAKKEIDKGDTSTLDYLTGLRDKGSSLIKSTLIKLGDGSVSIKQQWGY